MAFVNHAQQQGKTVCGASRQESVDAVAAQSHAVLCACRMTLAKCLQKPEGMTALRAELAAGGETDAAMAFLATAIKDHGAVPASNSLYRSVAFVTDHHISS